MDRWIGGSIDRWTPGSLDRLICGLVDWWIEEKFRISPRPCNILYVFYKVFIFKQILLLKNCTKDPMKNVHVPKRL